MNEHHQVVDHIDITHIWPDPDQPRRRCDEAALQDLAADIAVRGILQPITVRETEAGPMIVYGERRWLAAQLAGLKTVPCLWQAPGDDDPIERLFAQIAENEQRAPLNALEFAHVIDRLHGQHGIKMADIPGLLEQHGHKGKSRSYVSNLRRLLQLPQWAQDLVSEGKITPSHGKHLLVACASEAVIDQLHDDFRERLERGWDIPDVDGLLINIDRVYGMLHHEVNSAYSNATFNTDETCKGCPHRKPVNGSHYCLNEPCYDQHESAAVQARDEARKLRALERQIDASADPGKTTPDDSADTPPDSRRAGCEERAREWLDAQLREILRQDLISNSDVRYRVVLWMAAGAPGDYGYQPNGYRHAGNVRLEDLDDYRTPGLARALALSSERATDQVERDIITLGLDAMSRDNLRRLAHHIGLIVDDLQVDEEYIGIWTKQDLIDESPEDFREMMPDWRKASIKIGEVRQQILDGRFAYGCPPFLLADYAASAPNVSAETD
jgi:ParB/RepB/Spo0J family partition protein